MRSPSWLHLIQPRFPSANMILVRGTRPILIDTGFGSDSGGTEAALHAAGLPPEQLALIVNTHYHSDHAGGNYALQRRYGLPIAAHHIDVELVNRRDPGACAAVWLDQPIEPYWVDRPLEDGDTIDTGSVALRVIHTPGHTRGQISLYDPVDHVLICGDAVHGDDVAWINPFTEGAHPIDDAIRSIERLATLPVRWACSGHGPPMPNPPAAFAAAIRRYRAWQDDPRRLAWHACKRIIAYQLMLHDGMTAEEFAVYVTRQRWYLDYTRAIFQVAPEAFVQPLADELVRSRAADWRDGHLVALRPYTPPPPGWPRAAIHVADWPAGHEG